MKGDKLTGIVVGFLAGASALSGEKTTAHQPSEHQRLRAVPFTEIALDDEFWTPRIRTNRTKTVRHDLEWCSRTGRLNNFAKAGGLMEGNFEGIYFNDSDVYKVLEGAAYSLQAHPDPELENTVDEVIGWIAAAQREDGYLSTYYTLKTLDERWTNLRKMHELYCAGHLFEAAVAHYRTTGKRNFLDVAVSLADHIDSVFGPDKRYGVPGHEEIELALVKLYRLTGERRYLELAEFFLDQRGSREHREQLFGEYNQDHMPVREQSVPTGHAVRAMYLYSGMADVAGITGDKGLIEALDRLWDNTVNKKMYITGAVGSQHRGEAFGEDYQLPNDTAYCETCASIGMCLWNHRMNLLHGHAKYADVLEQTMYNGFLAGVGLEGDSFFYVNPLESDGDHHRQPFFGCACCPSNVVRFVPSVPGYVYAFDDSGIFVNLYAAGEGKIPLKSGPVKITQETRYPWDGEVRITVDPGKLRNFDLNVRIPSWCSDAEIRLNGEDIPAEERRDYSRIRRRWEKKDVVELTLPMSIDRVYAHPATEANVGRVALRRGPVVYCLEAADNNGYVFNLVLPRDSKLKAEYRSDLLGGCTVITGRALAVRADDTSGSPVDFTAIPYHLWDHREAGRMRVWIPESPELATLPPIPTIASESRPAASHCYSDDSMAALNDQLEPKNSSDHGIPRFTWWPHRGSTEWVQYTFKKSTRVSGVEVYWFDDKPRNGKCRVPESWEVLYKDGDSWKNVSATADYTTKLDCFNRITFTPVKTSALRITVKLKKGFSGGILEWRVEE